MLRLILMPIASGVVATAGMTGFLWAVNKSGWTNADMVRAVGSLVTKSYQRALGVGLLFQFLNGIIFAAAYLHVLALMGMAQLGETVFIGGVLGFAQGFLVGLAIFRFADRHPVEQFQQADYQVAIAHLCGHVIYGVLVGVIFSLMSSLGFDVSPAL